MATVAVVKVRSELEVTWQVGRLGRLLLRLARLDKLRARMEANAGRPYMSQLTLPYLAALGARHGEATGHAHRFVLVDEVEERVEAALPAETDLVLLTANTPSAPAAYRVADRLRRRGLRTVIGGIHASTLPSEAALHVDTVVTGEAEGAVDALLDDLAAGSMQPLYRGGRVSSLDGLPVPRWQDAAAGVDLCPWLVPVQTSRGCRNACTFCSTTGFQGARRRHRPVAEVVAEIRQLQAAGILTPDKTVFFTDNNIVGDSDHRHHALDTAYARSLFEALIPLRIDWVGQGEISLADDRSLLELAVRSGCHMLLVGFESLSQENLGMVRKPCNKVEQYARQIDLLHRHGVALIGCFILGMDHDTVESFSRTLPFIERYIDIPQISILTPFPGTGLYRKMEREGRIIDRDWSHYDISHVVFQPARMSPRELEEGYCRVTDRLFSPAAILKRALRYAATPTVPGLNPLALRSRFSSVLATNLIYGKLSRRAPIAGLPDWQPVGRSAAQEPAAQRAERGPISGSNRPGPGGNPRRSPGPTPDSPQPAAARP